MNHELKNKKSSMYIYYTLRNACIQSNEFRVILVGPFVFKVNVWTFTVSEDGFHMNNAISRDDATPIMVVIPGLTSDSSASVSSVFVFHSFLQMVSKYFDLVPLRIMVSYHTITSGYEDLVILFDHVYNIHCSI